MQIKLVEVVAVICSAIYTALIDNRGRSWICSEHAIYSILLLVSKHSLVAFSRTFFSMWEFGRHLRSEWCYGRVEVYYSWQWSTVCDNDWSINEEVNSTCLITSELANQRARKVLFTWRQLSRMRDIAAVGTSDCRSSEGASVKCV